MHEQLKCPNCGALEWIEVFTLAAEGERFTYRCYNCDHAILGRWYIDVEIIQPTKEKKALEAER